MDVVLGIRVKDSVIIATSKAVTRGISILKDSDDKTRILNDHNLMAFTGEAGDTLQFAEYIQGNVQLYGMREGYDLSPSAVASYTREQLATSIRSRKPYQVNVLLAGYDEKTDLPALNYIDYLGTRVELPYAAHGYAGFYAFSLLDHHYRPEMNVEEGLEILRMCNAEFNKRMPIDFKGLHVKVVDKNGVRSIEEL